MTLPIAEDLRAETDELHAFLETLEPEDWETPTLFMDWTPWDVVAHLHYFDLVSLVSLEGREAFAAEQKKLVEALQAGVSGKAQAREALGHLDAKSLVERWKASSDDLAAQLGASDPKRRLPWFGPDMGVAMFTTARYMETWAHSQAIYDLKQVARQHTDRIRNVCAIGVKTFGWTFVNRGLEPPGAPPYLRLTAPSGAIWEYNDESESERIEGTALDFCLTVTQVRHVKDTGLRVTGEVATRWMEIAQCFAGGPVDPPPPGHRLGRRGD